MARKRAGAEQMAVSEHELVTHTALLDRLESTLEAAHARSSLPEEPTTAAALDDFVVRLRLSKMDSMHG